MIRLGSVESVYRDLLSRSVLLRSCLDGQSAGRFAARRWRSAHHDRLDSGLSGIRNEPDVETDTYIDKDIGEAYRAGYSANDE